MLPSSHGVPFGALGFEHTPVDVLQVPASWHWSEPVQTTAGPAVQTPAWQLSFWVQALLSALQAVLFALGGFEQRPVDVLQVPASWHWSWAVQTTGVPVQVPLWQLSPVVQARPSLQLVPSDLAGFEQRPVVVSQVPATWHWSRAVPATHVPVQVPLWQVRKSVVEGTWVDLGGRGIVGI